MKWLDSIIDSMDMNLDKLQEMMRDREAWHASVHGLTKSRTQLVTEQQQQHSFVISTMEIIMALILQDCHDFANPYLYIYGIYNSIWYIIPII